MQPVELIPILIPAEVLKKAGITPECILQLYASNGRLVIEAINPDPDDFDCDDCPFYDEIDEYCEIFDD